MKRIILLLGILMVDTLLFACASKQITESVSSKEPAKPVEAKEAWQVEWENTLGLARKEGKVVVYADTSSAVARDIYTKIMREKYGLGVEVTSASGVELTPKILAERRAGLFWPDVYTGGVGSMINALKPQEVFERLTPHLILPEVLDLKVWWGGKLLIVDKQEQVMSMVAYPNIPFVINTNLVAEGEIKSYLDLLNPKWKGKIVMSDPTTPGSSQAWFVVVASSMIMNLDYLRELAKTDLMVFRDSRLQVEWLAQGKSAIAIGPRDPLIDEFRKAGAPIKPLAPKEGVHLSGGAGYIALMNKASHPNAAKIFLNWMLTKEGQTVFSLATGWQSARLDVPSDHIDGRLTRQEGVKYVSAMEEEFVKSMPKYMPIAREIVGPLLR